MRQSEAKKPAVQPIDHVGDDSTIREIHLKQVAQGVGGVRGDIAAAGLRKQLPVGRVGVGGAGVLREAVLVVIGGDGGGVAGRCAEAVAVGVVGELADQDADAPLSVDAESATSAVARDRDSSGSSPRPPASTSSSRWRIATPYRGRV